MGNSQHTPVKLGIGLPVYNGEVFIEEALESILAQNFQDFELIISDNASTDRTESICRIFAERDPRVKYYRNEQNIGVGPNHNRVFELSANEYFKWISYDDVHDHRFLEQCIRILDNDQSLVLAYSLAKTIDSKGKHLNEWGYFPELGSNQPHIRFRSSLSPPKGPLPLPIYGVIRSAILCKTSLLPGYSGCDRVLLSELSLYGRFYEISSALFFQREHHNRTGRILSDNPNMARRIWGGAQCGGLNLPFLGKFSVLRNALARPPLEFIERLLCYREFYVWIRREKKGLLNDLVLAEGRLSFVASFVQRYLDRKRKNDIRHLASFRPKTITH